MKFPWSSNLQRAAAALMAVSFLSITGCVPAAGQTQVSITFPEAIGAWLAPLFVAQQQGMFRNRNIAIDFIPATGASVPRVNNSIQFGFVGGPAALIQAAHGSDLKLIASFFKVHPRWRLVARPGIATSDELRGKRVGVRVLGAGIWIETVVALRELKLDPKKDNIEMVPIGGPPEILKAFAADNIDAALLPQAQTESLKAKGYKVILDQYPPNLYVYENGLIVATTYALAHPEVVTGVLDALVEAVHFIHQPKNKAAVVQALGLALKLPDGPALEQRYNELKGLAESPYPSIETLKMMQSLVSYHDPAVLNVRIEALVDDEFLDRLNRAEPKVH